MRKTVKLHLVYNCKNVKPYLFMYEYSFAVYNSGSFDVDSGSIEAQHHNEFIRYIKDCIEIFYNEPLEFEISSICLSFKNE